MVRDEQEKTHLLFSTASNRYPKYIGRARRLVLAGPRHKCPSQSQHLCVTLVPRRHARFLRLILIPSNLSRGTRTTRSGGGYAWIAACTKYTQNRCTTLLLLDRTRRAWEGRRTGKGHGAFNWYSHESTKYRSKTLVFYRRGKRLDKTYRGIDWYRLWLLGEDEVFLPRADEDRRFAANRASLMTKNSRKILTCGFAVINARNRSIEIIFFWRGDASVSFTNEVQYKGKYYNMRIIFFFQNSCTQSLHNFIYISFKCKIYCLYFVIWNSFSVSKTVEEHLLLLSLLSRRLFVL